MIFSEMKRKKDLEISKNVTPFIKLWGNISHTGFKIDPKSNV